MTQPAALTDEQMAEAVKLAEEAVLSHYRYAREYKVAQALLAATEEVTRLANGKEIYRRYARAQKAKAEKYGSEVTRLRAVLESATGLVDAALYTCAEPRVRGNLAAALNALHRALNQTTEPKEG